MAASSGNGFDPVTSPLIDPYGHINRNMLLDRYPTGFLGNQDLLIQIALAFDASYSNSRAAFGQARSILIDNLPKSGQRTVFESLDELIKAKKQAGKNFKGFCRSSVDNIGDYELASWKNFSGKIVAKKMPENIAYLKRINALSGVDESCKEIFGPNSTVISSRQKEPISDAFVISGVAFPLSYFGNQQAPDVHYLLQGRLKRPGSTFIKALRRVSEFSVYSRLVDIMQNGWAKLPNGYTTPKTRQEYVERNDTGAFKFVLPIPRLLEPGSSGAQKKYSQAIIDSFALNPIREYIKRIARQTNHLDDLRIDKKSGVVYFDVVAKDPNSKDRPTYGVFELQMTHAMNFLQRDFFSPDARAHFEARKYKQIDPYFFRDQNVCAYLNHFQPGAQEVEKGKMNRMYLREFRRRVKQAHKYCRATEKAFKDRGDAIPESFLDIKKEVDSCYDKLGLR